MTKIYTKTGDKGDTGLVGGKRISKGALRIEAYGDVDELNALLGVAASLLDPKDNDIREILVKIQEKLFVVGADLATPPDYRETQAFEHFGLRRSESERGEQYFPIAKKTRHKGTRFVPEVQGSDVVEVEKWIDRFEADLPKLENFILPSGTTAGSFLHLARTVCRRGEREVVRLSKEESIGEEVVKYLNRLSDFLFVLARTVNRRGEMAETPWIPKPA